MQGAVLGEWLQLFVLDSGTSSHPENQTGICGWSYKQCTSLIGQTQSLKDSAHMVSQVQTKPEEKASDEENINQICCRKWWHQTTPIRETPPTLTCLFNIKRTLGLSRDDSGFWRGRPGATLGASEHFSGHVVQNVGGCNLIGSPRFHVYVRPCSFCIPPAHCAAPLLFSRRNSLWCANGDHF